MFGDDVDRVALLVRQRVIERLQSEQDVESFADAEANQVGFRRDAGIVIGTPRVSGRSRARAGHVGAMAAAGVGIGDVLHRDPGAGEPEVADDVHVLDRLLAELQVGVVAVDAGVDHGHGTSVTLQAQAVVHGMAAGDLAGLVIEVLQGRIEVDALDAIPAGDRLHLRAGQDRARHRRCFQRPHAGSHRRKARHLAEVSEGDEDFVRRRD